MGRVLQARDGRVPNYMDIIIIIMMNIIIIIIIIVIINYVH